MPRINQTHQLVILARLSEYCQYRGDTLKYESDPWSYMRRKLTDTEQAFTSLKKELFNLTKNKLLEEMKTGEIDEERYADFKALFERLLAPGDFADLAIHLSTQGAAAQRLRTVTQLLDEVKPHTLFIEENKPPEERSPAWEKLIGELYRRLDFERLGAVLKRKPRTARRKAVILRRVRRNVAEYCSVLHIPTDPNDTFTPFMLPRVEALIAANLRFLGKYR